MDIFLTPSPRVGVLPQKVSWLLESHDRRFVCWGWDSWFTTELGTFARSGRRLLDSASGYTYVVVKIIWRIAFPSTVLGYTCYKVWIVFFFLIWNVFLVQFQCRSTLKWLGIEDKIFGVGCCSFHRIWPISEDYQNSVLYNAVSHKLLSTLEENQSCFLSNHYNLLSREKNPVFNDDRNKRKIQIISNSQLLSQNVSVFLVSRSPHSRSIYFGYLTLSVFLQGFVIQWNVRKMSFFTLAGWKRQNPASFSIRGGHVETKSSFLLGPMMREKDIFGTSDWIRNWLASRGNQLNVWSY